MKIKPGLKIKKKSMKKKLSNSQSCVHWMGVPVGLSGHSYREFRVRNCSSSSLDCVEVEEDEDAARRTLIASNLSVWDSAKLTGKGKYQKKYHSTKYVSVCWLTESIKSDIYDRKS